MIFSQILTEFENVLEESFEIQDIFIEELIDNSINFKEIFNTNPCGFIAGGMLECVVDIKMMKEMYNKVYNSNMPFYIDIKIENTTIFTKPWIGDITGKYFIVSPLDGIILQVPTMSQHKKHSYLEFLPKSNEMFKINELLELV